MAKQKRPTKHFHCYWCGQATSPPVKGVDRNNRTIMICPDCRGPV